MAPIPITPSACRRLKFLQITIEERVFVVPFDLQREVPAIGRVEMVDFVADRLFLYAIDNLLNFDIAACASRAHGSRGAVFV